MTVVIDEARVRGVLNGIVDPCSVAAGAPAGLDDMGIILDIVCTPAADGTDVRVRLGATDPHCLMTGAFMAESHRLLSTLSGIGKVDVAMDRTAIWTPARLSAEYAARLAETRAIRRKSRAVPRGPG